MVREKNAGVGACIPFGFAIAIGDVRIEAPPGRPSSDVSEREARVWAVACGAVGARTLSLTFSFTLPHYLCTWSMCPCMMEPEDQSTHLTRRRVGDIPPPPPPPPPSPLSAAHARFVQAWAPAFSLLLPVCRPGSARAPLPLSSSSSSAPRPCVRACWCGPSCTRPG